MNVMDCPAKISLLLLFFVVGWAKQTSGPTYCMKLATCGYTVPAGDIVLEYGQPLNINCHIYPNYGYNASSALFFTRSKKTDYYPNNDYDVLDETAGRVEVLNSSSIRLTIRKPEKMKEFFYCYCNISNKAENRTMACSNSVMVGVKPQEITDFKCKSFNWDFMNCSWTAPENYVATVYNITYRFPDYLLKPGSKSPKKFNKTPPKPLTVLNDSSNKSLGFTFGFDSIPFYLQSQETYEFYITMNNTFGITTQNFTWNHYQNIYTKPPQELTGNSTSPSEIRLCWNISTYLIAFPKNFIYRIMYKCRFYDSWRLGALYVPKKKENLCYTLTNLEYAHVHYDVRISMKTEEGVDETWSDNSTVIVITKSKIPDYPPSTTLGSFQILNSAPKKIVYVYFQQIPPQSENGEDFKYVVESNPSLTILEQTSAYVKFEGLQSGQGYNMRIWSENIIGRSKRYSEVVIPSKRIKEPYRLWKIEHTPVKYELKWQENPDSGSVTNYTIFWCVHETDRPHQCTGFLNWTVVPKNVLKHSITVQPVLSKFYHFAIASNSIEGSSGMLWASCTILANRTVLKINELIIKNVGSDFIELNWRQDCPDLNSEVIGYVIYYCATNETYTDNCTSPMKNVTVEGSLGAQIGRVKNLTPYTTYLLAVSVKTKSAIGEKSDFVRNATSEAAPSTPPQNITFDMITNSSIMIKWTRPEITNGKIKNYYINYTFGEAQIPGTSESFNLTDLQSYKVYNISIKACTTACSKPSESSTVRTKMGTPGPPFRPYFNDTVNGLTYISWNKPYEPRGEIKYYQVLITHDLNNDTGEILNGTQDEVFSINDCGANSQYSGYTMYVRVRAVNIIDNEHRPGPWSEPYKTNCNHESWLLTIYIALIIVAAFIMAFVGKRVYTCYRVMQNVEVKLPPGLSLSNERSEKNLTDIGRDCPDEALLLEEKITEKCTAGDSSGCSSGQESITSSVESTAHLSIDSGTDQPRNVIDDNKENSSLRLRNVSSKGYVSHDATPIINRGTKPAPTIAGNYCKLGVDPVQDSPYVTISDIESSTSPYISADKLPIVQAPFTDFYKTPNPGYVPFANPEPASKNTDYVLAGDLTSPVVEKTTEFLLTDVPLEGLKPSPVWQQPSLEPSQTKPGYVSVGDAPPPTIVKESNKGYVPHRQFEAKSLKED